MTVVTNPAVDAIGETTCVVRASGDDDVGTMFFALRNTGAYGSSEQTAVRNGTGADWFGNDANAWRTGLAASGLDPNDVYYLGVFVDDGAESPVVGTSFTTTALLAVATGGKVLPRGAIVDSGRT